MCRQTLKDLLPGERGMVLSVQGEGAIRCRLFDMGITPGCAITMRKAAPMGDPLKVSLRGYELSIRKSEAAYVLMERQA